MGVRMRGCFFCPVTHTHARLVWAIPTPSTFVHVPSSPPPPPPPGGSSPLLSPPPASVPAFVFSRRRLRCVLPPCRGSGVGGGVLCTGSNGLPLLGESSVPRGTAAVPGTNHPADHGRILWRWGRSRFCVFVWSYGCACVCVCAHVGLASVGGRVSVWFVRPFCSFVCLCARAFVERAHVGSVAP